MKPWKVNEILTGPPSPQYSVSKPVSEYGYINLRKTENMFTLAPIY